MAERINCEKGVFARFRRPGPDGSTEHFTMYASYDPEQLVSCVRVCTNGERYYSGTIHQGSTIAFSTYKETETTQVYNLSLSGGEKATRKKILEDISRILGETKERSGWVSISPREVVERDMFKWTVYLV